jgi:hypothetical protein
MYEIRREDETMRIVHADQLNERRRVLPRGEKRATLEIVEQGDDELTINMIGLVDTPLTFSPPQDNDKPMIENLHGNGSNWNHLVWHCPRRLGQDRDLLAVLAQGQYKRVTLRVLNATSELDWQYILEDLPRLQAEAPGCSSWIVQCFNIACCVGPDRAMLIVPPLKGIVEVESYLQDYILRSHPNHPIRDLQRPPIQVPTLFQLGLLIQYWNVPRQQPPYDWLWLIKEALRVRELYPKQSLIRYSPKIETISIYRLDDPTAVLQCETIIELSTRLMEPLRGELRYVSECRQGDVISQVMTNAVIAFKCETCDMEIAVKTANLRCVGCSPSARNKCPPPPREETVWRRIPEFWPPYFCCRCHVRIRDIYKQCVPCWLLGKRPPS